MKYRIVREWYTFRRLGWEVLIYRVVSSTKLENEVRVVFQLIENFIELQLNED